MVEAAQVAVTGANGMLGADLVALGCKGFKKSELDITDEDSLDVIGAPSVVINCAAYTAVDRAEDDRERCWEVNVQGVERLARYCREHGIILVQISTDYVFDGRKKGYDEDDPVNPVNYYGRTKAEAEAIVRNLEKHYIVRTSWLYGRNGENFVEKLLAKEGPVRVVDDQYGSPTYTKDLAEALLRLSGMPYGTYHLTNAGSCTWYEFAKAVRQDVEPCASTDYPTKAARPTYSILHNSKTEKLRHWEEALREYMEAR